MNITFDHESHSVHVRSGQRWADYMHLGNDMYIFESGNEYLLGPADRILTWAEVCDYA